MILMGRSLGGALAIHVASKYPDLFRCMIIENTFTSISDMVDELFAPLKYFKSLILKIGWRSIDIVSSLEIPVLYITGD
jgi:pimeloyl-ACP methyl ester carboxylesterase